MHAIDLSAETFTRLQALATPFVDTPEMVICRALDALEGVGDPPKSDDNATRMFEPESPPSLSFTTVRSIIIEGVRLPRYETYWNSGLSAAIRLAAKRGVSRKQISEIIQINSFDGRKDDGGYKYIPEIDLSVQGQDANTAWRALNNIAKLLVIELEVVFSWQDNSKAAYPGGWGRFKLLGRR